MCTYYLFSLPYYVQIYEEEPRSSMNTAINIDDGLLRPRDEDESTAAYQLRQDSARLQQARIQYELGAAERAATALTKWNEAAARLNQGTPQGGWRNAPPHLPGHDYRGLMAGAGGGPPGETPPDILRPRPAAGPTRTAAALEGWVGEARREGDPHHRTTITRRSPALGALTTIERLAGPIRARDRPGCARPSPVH